MPILQSLGIKGYGLTRRVSANISFIGGNVVNGPQNQPYTSGTQNGDLVVFVSHNFSGSVTPPSGFTSAFTTPGNQYSYAKNVAYKIVSGDTSAILSSGTGFDGTVLTFRGATSVSTSYSVADINTGGSTNLSAAASGTAVIIASDRGGTSSFSVGSYDSYITGGVTYFYEFTAIKNNYTSGTPISVTDYNDGLGTHGLIFVVQ